MDEGRQGKVRRGNGNEEVMKKKKREDEEVENCRKKGSWMKK